jgi:hypothetical protein
MAMERNFYVMLRQALKQQVIALMMEAVSPKRP